MTKDELNNLLIAWWYDGEWADSIPYNEQDQYYAFSWLLCELIGRGEWND